MKPSEALRRLAALFTPVTPAAKNLDTLADTDRELHEPYDRATLTPFQVMISDAVRDGLRKAQDPVEILCGETVSFEELRTFLTRKRGAETPVSDHVVREYVSKHAIPEVATRIYSLGHAVRAAQAKS